MSNQLALTDDEKKVIMKNFFPPTATKEDMAFCMGVANQFGLNPLLNQIYFVERSTGYGQDKVTKTVPMVGRGGFQTIAHKSGQFAGIETSVDIAEAPTFKNGVWINESDLVATCKVYRKDTEKAFIVSVAFKEYAQKKYGGALTKFWQEKGVTMLKKVAESQALRSAFNVNGIYIEEEINDNKSRPEAQAPQVTEVDEINAMLTQDLTGKNVDIVDGQVTENDDIDEMPAYVTPEKTTLEIEV